MSLDVVYSSTCRLVWYLCWTNQCDKLQRIRIWPSRRAREWNKNKLKVLETFEAPTFPIIFFKKYSLLHNKYICWLNKFRHSTCLVFFPLLLKLEQITDSQMFVKVYPQHLTLVFSDQALHKTISHFNVFFDQLLDRRTATWNLFPFLAIQLAINYDFFTSRERNNNGESCEVF